MWFKWHLLNLGLKFKAISGGLKRTAVDEVNNVSKKDEATFSAGNPLHYERDVASRYYDFWDSDFSNLGRMNLYFFLIIAAVVTTITRFVMGGVNQGAVSEDYLLMSAAGIGALLLILFIFELFRKKGDDIPVSEAQYENAQAWMHAIAEKARRHMPLWAIAIIAIGLVVEAGAISMIAVSFAGDMSKTISTYVGIILGAIFAAVLGILVHKAGEGLYREHHRKRLHRVIRNEGGYAKDEEGNLVSETYSALKSDKNDFHTDEEGFMRRKGIMLLAILMVLGLAALAFYQRAELNLGILADQTEIESMDVILSPDSMIPAEVTSAQQSSQRDVVNEDASHAKNGMFAALGILTLVFIVINGIGMMFGYNYSFYDDHSEKYYMEIKKYREQMSLRVKDAVYATLARQKVLKKSNQFFTKFQQHAVKQARREGLDSLQESLNERGAYKMERFVENQGVKA